MTAATDFHEDCGMPMSSHSVVCPQPRPVVTADSLRRGPQPDTLSGWCGMAIGAATTIPYGPGVNEPFDEESANNILDWLLEGIHNLEASEK
jgi:hypothetical protein